MRLLRNFVRPTISARSVIESKNLGELYHLVSLNSMKFAIENNKLKFNKHYEPNEDYEYISLTRDKFLTHIEGVKEFKLFKFIIDADKLSERYKIVPYSYTQYNSGFIGKNLPSESEERVITSEIRNLFSYVKGVIIIVSKDMKIRKKTFDMKNIYTLRDLRNYKSPMKIIDYKSFAQYYEDIYSIIDFLKENNIPLYVQEDNKISKNLGILNKYLLE